MARNSPRASPAWEHAQRGAHTPAPAPASAPTRARTRARAGRSAWGLYRETRLPGAPGLLTRLAALPRMVVAVLRRSYPGLSRRKLLAFSLLAALYVLSPLDAIPDVIPVLGWTDDSAVVLWFVTGLVRESGRYVEWERRYRQ